MWVLEASKGQSRDDSGKIACFRIACNLFSGGSFIVSAWVQHLEPDLKNVPSDICDLKKALGGVRLTTG